MTDNIAGKLEQILAEAKKTVNMIATEADLKSAELRFLARKSQLTEILRSIREMSNEEKQTIGKRAQEVRQFVQSALNKKRTELTPQVTTKIDVTEPGESIPVGSLHPNTQLQYELEEIFERMGFNVIDGPQLESDFFNFEAVNTPPHHPARDMQDTFWLTDGNLLRTHTSAVQVRAMQKFGAPLRAIVPGRVFRHEAIDATHENTFYQLEGMMIDKGISISHLIATMRTLLESIFQTKDIKVRLRPGYFPFVEPGFELDMYTDLFSKGGKKHYRWLELLPCGMIHPRVLEFGGIDPKKYSGFAFGLGLTRLVMLKYGIHDIRLLQSGDLRFLKQFS